MDRCYNSGYFADLLASLLIYMAEKEIRLEQLEYWRVPFAQISGELGDIC